MNISKRAALAVLLAVTCVSAGDLLAQRRTTGSSGSDGRRAPSGSGGSTRSSGGSRSGGSRPTASPSRGSGGSQPSTRATGDRPSSGKIAAVRREARAARSTGSVYIDRRIYIDRCWNCDYWGWYGGGWGWYHRGWWYPSRHPYPYEPPREYDDEDGDEEADVGQGYLAYPYASARGSGATFVQQRTRTRTGFGAATLQYFSDVGSTTQAGRFAFEGAWRAFRGEFEYSQYVEPLAGGNDRLHTYRVAVGAQPRLGNRAYLVAGIGLRGVNLENGDEAAGPEGELGLQIFPSRPLGINVTGRLAAIEWNDNGDYFSLRELNSTASVFVGRVEIQAGWHFLKIGNSPAFAGPVVGTRLWF